MSITLVLSLNEGVIRNELFGHTSSLEQLDYVIEPFISLFSPSKRKKTQIYILHTLHNTTGKMTIIPEPDWFGHFLRGNFFLEHHLG